MCLSRFGYLIRLEEEKRIHISAGAGLLVDRPLFYMFHWLRQWKSSHIVKIRMFNFFPSIHIHRSFDGHADGKDTYMHVSSDRAPLRTPETLQKRDGTNWCGLVIVDARKHVCVVFLAHTPKTKPRGKFIRTHT